jgi:hypothetical protein
LEEAGYTVFSDILNLEPGDRWRKVITNTLQTRAIKMLLCCRDTTLAKDNVQEEMVLPWTSRESCQTRNSLFP